MDGFTSIFARPSKENSPRYTCTLFRPTDLYGATLSNRSIEDYLKALKDAGIGSLPGTSAEILDDRVREIIFPGRISTSNWIEVIRTAHRLGIPTASTIMYGHVGDRVGPRPALGFAARHSKGNWRHQRVRSTQLHRPRGAHGEKSLVPGIRTEVTRDDVLRMYAVAA